MENKHAVFIPVDVLTQVRNLAKQANALLPFVTSLTPAERRTMAKMGEKTLSFVEKAHEFAQQNPNLVPPFLDMAAFDTDFADAHNLWSVVWGINAGSFSKPALREELLLFLNK